MSNTKLMKIFTDKKKLFDAQLKMETEALEQQQQQQQKGT